MRLAFQTKKKLNVEVGDVFLRNSNWYGICSFHVFLLQMIDITGQGVFYYNTFHPFAVIFFILKKGRRDF
jgi:hypothetical protein